MSNVVEYQNIEVHNTNISETKQNTQFEQQSNFIVEENIGTGAHGTFYLQ
jgi:hypothetical protein